LAGWPVGWLAGWLVGRLAAKSIGFILNNQLLDSLARIEPGQE